MCLPLVVLDPPRKPFLPTNFLWRHGTKPGFFFPTPVQERPCSDESGGRTDTTRTHSNDGRIWLSYDVIVSNTIRNGSGVNELLLYLPAKPALQFVQKTNRAVLRRIAA